ncbi:MAG: tRNA (adenosine(37)-N6)-dimethylallyltransferase MiaA [Ignavibacteriae bacterium]|nr:MAG: tRNA (adenosine(37)-N6)-dimethylallyltransferase MiaA [Ignavibacteriota bacterium]
MSKNKLITILGPTAVGKTKFAAELASKYDGEIISADSRQVYIGMDIGTGKDYYDYTIANKKIPYHLIDIVKPECEFNLYLFTQLFTKAFIEITKRKKLPFLVGGTGLYLSSIIQKYNLNFVDFYSQRAKQLFNFSIEELKEILLNIKSDLHNTTDLIEKERIVKAILIAEDEKGNKESELKIDSLIIGLYDEREKIKDNIRKRLKKRLQNGMIEETEKLLVEGISHEKLRFFGLEYKFMSMYIRGELNYNDMYQKLASEIIQFSKRQMTWFRKMEREGIKIHWLKNNQLKEAIELVEEFL